jgi:hypothetical protein
MNVSWTQTFTVGVSAMQQVGAAVAIQGGGFGGLPGVVTHQDVEFTSNVTNRIFSSYAREGSMES